MGTDGRHVLALIEPARSHRESLGANQADGVGVEICSPALSQHLQIRLLKSQMNTLRTQLRAVFYVGIERGQEGGGHLTPLMSAAQFEMITAVINCDIQTLFNLTQMTVQLPAEGRQIARIVWFE